MSDPFSVAGSAVGVVSLGLTVCQGLITYYGQHKSFHKEIKDTTSQLENLDSILKVLMSTLQKGELQNVSYTAEPARIAEDTIRRCDQRLRELEEKLQRCRESGISPDRTFKFSKARALYPFRRNTLMALRESVGWLQSNLGNSLSLLNLSLTIADHLQITSIASISVSTNQSIELIRERMDQMESTIRIAGPQCTQKPAVLQSLLEKTEQLERDMKTLALQPYNPSKPLPNDYAYSHMSSGKVWLGHQQNRTRRASGAAHEEQLHAAENNSFNLYKRMSLWKGFFDVVLQVSLKIITGAGGNAINRNPRFHATVPDNSPAFALFTFESAQSMRRDQRHRQLLELFRSGKASPLDKLASGKTLLSKVAADYLVDKSEIPAWLALMKSLIECGASPDELDVHGWGPGRVIVGQMISYHLIHSDEALLEQELITICRECLDSGVVLGICKSRHNEYVPGYRDTFIVKRILKVISQIIMQDNFYDTSDFDVPEPLIPFLLRSQNKLERLLKRGVDFQAELQFYASWPEALGTLLQAGYEPDYRTMQQALESGVAAVRVLRDAGKLYPELCIPYLAECSHPEATEMVFQELANERKQLWTTAVTHLPIQALLHLDVRPDTLLGFKAAQVQCLLETHGIYTGKKMSREGYLVYNSVKMNVELANQMWNHGFRDVDDMDDMGMTALMKLEPTSGYDAKFTTPKLLRMASWLIEKGANIRLSSKIGDRYSALHFLAAALAASLNLKCIRASYYQPPASLEPLAHSIRKNHPVAQLPSSSEAVLHSILLDDSRDSCNCYCSPGGCTPIAVLLDALTEVSVWIYPKDHADMNYIAMVATAIFPGIFASLQSKSPEAFEEKVLTQALRSITFRALDMRHTCAHHEESKFMLTVYQPFDSEEIKEIHEEDRDMINELELLVQEFVSDYKMLSLTV